MARTTRTCDAVDPGRRAAFWAAVTGRQLAESTPDVALLTSATEPVRLLVLKVAEGKTGNNRLPRDGHAADRAAEGARLCSLGATAHATHQEYGLTWTVITDPEGTACCIVQTGPDPLVPWEHRSAADTRCQGVGRLCDRAS